MVSLYLKLARLVPAMSQQPQGSGFVVFLEGHGYKVAQVLAIIFLFLFSGFSQRAAGFCCSVGLLLRTNLLFGSSPLQWNS